MSTTHTTPGGSRRLVLTLAVTVALLCTAVAYEGMYQFGLDMLGWSVGTALAFAGIFELAQLTVALLAREAIKDGRPAGTLLTFTWMLAGASGFLAAWHELDAGHGIGAALFRIAAPVLAAGLWHLVLLGDRHLAAGRSWAQMRADARMHRLFLTVEDAARAHETGKGIQRAEAARRRARAVALRTVPPEDMRAKATAWLGSLSAVADATTDVARMHLETNARVAGLAPTATLVQPDYEAQAAESVRSELEAMTGPDRTARRSPVRSGNRSKPRRSALRSGADRADRSARLAIVSGLLDQAPDASGPDAQAALAAAGHEVSDGYARKLLREARATTQDRTPDEAPAMAAAVADAAPVLVEA
ncbi:hypothetical protein [Promicromonospora iranensis]|uniref:DUF2637 domain-containing protein n=1 Tax=Promicromonospora iranensis TaxID=1105144 RepID=A0ABU2CQ93_9MICO|nr:hypothetical protein [Promicromonospora iranensis]MDR7383513.1 hypothetical protein [Promicromonospora iranensis]